MNANPVLDAILARRSIRSYTGEPVTAEEIGTVLEAGRWAPSGKNNQPWRFLVVRRGDPRQETLAGLTKHSRIVLGAEALFCVFLDKDVVYNTTKDIQSIGACLQNMLLGAHSLGLGAVWLGEIINREPEVTRALELDDDSLELMAVLAVGRPAKPGDSRRKPLSELMLEPLRELEEDHARGDIRPGAA